MDVLYLDTLFLLNLLADYLLCLAAGRLCGLVLKRRRYLLAALFGAAYALLAQLSALRLPASPAGILCAGLLMGWIAFGGEAQLLRCLLTLFGCAALFGGALYALCLMGGGPPVFSPRVLLVSFLVCYGVLKLLSRFRARWDGSRRARIRLRLAGRETDFSALVDSGNSVRDPISGAALLIVSPRALLPVFREYTDLLRTLSPVELAEAAAQIPPLAGRVRLVPFRSLGGGGLLPAFRPDYLSVDGKETRELLVAVSPEAEGSGYEAIL